MLFPSQGLSKRMSDAQEPLMPNAYVRPDPDAFKVEFVVDLDAAGEPVLSAMAEALDDGGAKYLTAGNLHRYDQMYEASNRVANAFADYAAAVAFGLRPVDFRTRLKQHHEALQDAIDFLSEPFIKEALAGQMQSTQLPDGAFWTESDGRDWADGYLFIDVTKERLAAVASMLPAIVAANQSAGRDKDRPLNALARALAEVYVSATGKEPTRTGEGGNAQPTPFERFMSACYAHYSEVIAAANRSAAPGDRLPLLTQSPGAMVQKVINERKSGKKG